jgi:DNA-directed RNA polymerase subunit omega
MLDIEFEEELVRQVGGKFALTSLLQKRLVELNRGDPPLIEMGEELLDARRIACREILEGKITLALYDDMESVPEKEPLQITEEPAPEEEEGTEIYGSDIKKIKEQRIKELSQLLNPKT